MKSIEVIHLSITFYLAVVVQAQSDALYVSFMGQTLANNAYVDLESISSSVNGSVQCHTGLSSCCINVSWFFPNGDMVNTSEAVGIYQVYDNGQVNLYNSDQGSNNNHGLHGIYRCVIFFNDSSESESVHVGIYAGETGKSIF